MDRFGRIVAVVIWAALMAWGLVGLYGRLAHGHDAAAYGSYVPWGLWVSTYIYFVGLSAGSFLLSSLIYVFGLKQFAAIGRSALFTAAVTLLMSLLSIWFDLGHMERFYEVFTRPSFSSIMAWMVWLYTAYFLLILLELWLELRVDLSQMARKGGVRGLLFRLLTLGWRAPENPEELETCRRKSASWLQLLGATGVPLAIAFHGGVGALFATLSSRTYWHSSLFPILFLTGALASGGGLLLAITAFGPGSRKHGNGETLRLLGRMVLALVVFDLILEWSETSVPIWYGVGHDTGLYKEILFGRFWYVFWIVHILLGAVIPVTLILLKPRARWAMGAAGILVAVTFLAVRLNIVIPGQITPALKGLQSAYVDRRLLFHYVPSLFEWSVVAFIVSLGWGLFFLGNRILPLRSLEPEAR